MLMISGWAFPPEAWEFVCKQWESIWNVRIISASSLLRDSGPSSLRSDIVRGIRAHLPADRPCFLGGWSLGGMLALESAASLREELSGLLLISTTPHFCKLGIGETSGIVRTTYRNPKDYSTNAAPAPEMRMFGAGNLV